MWLNEEINSRVSSELGDFLRLSVSDMYSFNVATGQKELSSGKEINSTFGVDFPGLDAQIQKSLRNYLTCSKT